MPLSQILSLSLMSLLYFVAGISHFRSLEFFLKITPKWVLFPEKINRIVGFIELMLAIALPFSETRSLAAMGVITLLMAVFPANIYHFQLAVRKGKYIIPTLIRLPIQGLLIYWAYTFI